MKKFRDYAVMLIVLPLLAIAGCAADKAEIVSFSSAALDDAAAVGAAYALVPGHDPKVVANEMRLLAIAQAAEAKYAASTAPSDQAAFAAALAALVEYENIAPN